MTSLRPGDHMIEFKLPGVDNQKYTAHEFKGKKAIVIIFSCNHCPYVQAWEDRMIEIQKDYADRDVQLVAINSNDPQKYSEDNFENMKKRAQEKGFNFPYLYDESQEIAHAYGAERTPEVFLFDGKAMLRYHGAIDDNYEDPAEVQKHYLRDALDSVLAGDNPEIPSTPPVGCTIKWK